MVINQPCLIGFDHLYFILLGTFIVISDKILERGEPIRDRCLDSVVDFFIGVDGIVGVKVENNG
jgi:hypothetical protein